MFTAHCRAIHKTALKVSPYKGSKCRNRQAVYRLYTSFFVMLMLIPLAHAKDNIYSWQTYQQVHFTDVPPKNTHYQLHLLHADTINNKNTTPNNTKNSRSSSTHKRSYDDLLNHEDISTITYCENIRKTLSQLRHQKSFRWDTKTQRLVKKTPKRKLIKNLQKEIISHCMQGIQLNFADTRTK